MQLAFAQLLQPNIFKNKHLSDELSTQEPAKTNKQNFNLQYLHSKGVEMNFLSALFRAQNYIL